MTVCIAAICEVNAPTGGQIVICVDAKASTDLGSVDSHIKDRTLTLDWRCLTAGSGDDVTAVLPLLRKQLRGATEPIDETNICGLVTRAIAERKRQKADEHTLGRWALTYADFLAAKGQFPDDVFADEMRAIGQIAVETELIVVGYLADGQPTLVHAYGEKAHIKDHFATAGEGSSLAHAALMYRDHKFTDSLEAGLFCALEAKRHAQRVPSVGTFTGLVVHRRSASPIWIAEPGIAYLDKLIQKHGPKPLKDNLAMPLGSYWAINPEGQPTEFSRAATS